MRQMFSSCLVFMLLATGCLGSDNDSENDVVLYEGDEPGECSDGADNDKDGLFDCDDDQCSGAPVCKSTEEEDQKSDLNSTESDNTNNQEENDNKTVYIPGLDYGTGWNVSDIIHNINFTDKDGEKFELYEISTDFIAVNFVATWSGPDLAELEWKSTNKIWKDYSEDITDITVVIQNDIRETPSLYELNDLDTQFPNSSIMTKNAILMTDANAWEVANFQSFPTTIFIEKNSVGKFVIDSINPSFNEIMDKIDDFGISGTGYTVGHIPYNFRFVDYNSPEMDSYSLYDFKGEYIILEIGALWCGACDTTEEILNDFNRDYINFSPYYENFNIISLMQEGERYETLPTDLELKNHLNSEERSLSYHFGYSEDVPTTVYYEGLTPYYVIYGPSENLDEEMVVLAIIGVSWNDASELRTVLDEIKNQDIEEPEEDKFTIPFSECFIYVKYSNDTKNFEYDDSDDMFGQIYPEWCNYQQNGAERLTLDIFNEMSEVYYDRNNLSEVDETSALFENYWLSLYDENRGVSSDVYINNFSIEKGLEWFGEEYCSEEYDEYGLTRVDILGLGELCGGAAYDFSSSNSMYFTDNGKFYCIVDWIDEANEPLYCLRYELVYADGIEYLFFSNVTDFMPSIEK